MTKKELKQMIREIAYRDVSPWNRGENIPDKYEAPISDGPMKKQTNDPYSHNDIAKKKAKINSLIQRLQNVITSFVDDEETLDYIIELLYQANDATATFIP